ncbi:MAG: hypothetical protein KDC54_09095, partial [Lewinella sp.]|nr:hypothetical protein [Lewinella sp.]
KFLGLTQDIEYTAHQRFSDKYLIQGDDPELVADMIPDALARYFSVEGTWSLEGIGYYLIFYHKSNRLPPQQIKRFYRKGMEIVNWLRTSDPFVPPTNA